jgi:ketosteroid isomerase-like protein
MKQDHPNLNVLKKLDIANIAASAEVIAENFVWHYFNPELPQLQGDYAGIEGVAGFFKKLAENTAGTFKVQLISAEAMGDELVVTHVKDIMTLKGRQMEVDAVVVWSIVDGKIREAWDIPAVRKAKVLPC